MNRITSEFNLKKFKFKIVLLTSFSLVLIGLVLFNQLDQIIYTPETSPDAWCDSQPCDEINLAATDFTLVQPSSTLFVYLLGIITIGLGVALGLKTKDQKSQIWWGRSLILWGLGALFAGTSYQAFSYEIKCVGRDLCLWTSWWEVMYMILTVGSINCMMMAQSYSCVIEKNRKYHRVYASTNMMIYGLISLIGAIYPVKLLISFELMVLFLIPSFLSFTFTNFQRYRVFHNSMDKRLILQWVSLGLILVIYFLYLFSGLTERFWEDNIWFSENDVLHIGLILWMVYVYHNVVNYVFDLPMDQNT